MTQPMTDEDRLIDAVLRTAGELIRDMPPSDWEPGMTINDVYGDFLDRLADDSRTPLFRALLFKRLREHQDESVGGP